MWLGEARTQPIGAPKPRCASGLSATSATPGAPRTLIACCRQTSSKPRRMAAVPITWIGSLPPPAPGAIRVAVASPVGVSAGGGKVVAGIGSSALRVRSRSGPACGYHLSAAFQLLPVEGDERDLELVCQRHVESIRAADA